MDRIFSGIHDARALGGPLSGVSFVGGVATAMATARSAYPRPGAAPDAVRRYFSGSSTSARISAAGQLLSCAALATFIAPVVRLARQSGRGSRILEAAAVTGGGLAVVTLATSAVASAALTRERSDLTRVRNLHTLVFLAGGPTHNVGLGVLTGVVGLAGLATGALPSMLCRACLAVAPLGIVSPLSLAAKPTMAVIPLARFPALILSGIAGAMLARRRPWAAGPVRSTRSPLILLTITMKQGVRSEEPTPTRSSPIGTRSWSSHAPGRAGVGPDLGNGRHDTLNATGIRSGGI